MTNTTDTMMVNPYIAYAEQMTGAILDGERVEITPTDQPGLSDRLRNLAFYCTENQKTAADALLVIDLHAAADALKNAS